MNDEARGLDPSDPRDPDPRGRWLLLILPLAAVVLYFGWKHMFFLCDDSFIAFRYILNRRLGYGYVWNPPPFAPVEGYTSFSWVVILDALWTITGYGPPRTAPFVGGLCALGTVFVTAWMAWRVPLPPRMQPARPLGVALVLFGLLTNKTFLVWTSSGLETPLFVLLHVAWVGWATLGPRGPRWTTVGVWLGVGMALTRPDGLLYLAATLAFALVDPGVGGARPRLDRWTGLPLVAFGAHLVWRRWFYGAWVPNTYFAKVGDPWPWGGWLHFSLYVLENAWFVWVPLLAFAGASFVRRLRRQGFPTAWIVPSLAVGAVLFHLVYDIVIVGGDHFEFRIYAHLPSLIFVATLPMLASALGRWSRVAPVFAVMVACTWIIAWPDFFQMIDRDVPEAPKVRHKPVAPLLPAVLAPWAELHDRTEKEAVAHVLGLPWVTHKWFRIHHGRRFPAREEILATFGPHDWEAGATGKTAFPVTGLQAVGIPAWNLPYVAILDKYGLNDRVIARNLPKLERHRWSAHDRFPPPGYIDCFKPSVDVQDKFVVKGRSGPFDGDDIRACEAKFFAAVARGETDRTRAIRKAAKEAEAQAEAAP